MSYCQKCGAEVSNDAQFCSKCGSPVNYISVDAKNTDKSVNVKIAQNEHKKAGLVLSNIATIGNMAIFCYFYYIFFLEKKPTPSTTGGTMLIGKPGYDPSFTVLWITINILLFCLGIYLYKYARGKMVSSLSYVYIIISVVSFFVLNVAVPNIWITVVCLIGVLFYVPTFLQIAAGIKFLQGGHE